MKRETMLEKYRETLKLYAEGNTETEVAQQLGTGRSAVQHRLKYYRGAGILAGTQASGDVVVNWPLLEEQTGGKSEETPASNTPAIPGIPKVNTETIPGIFLPVEVIALRALAARESLRSDPRKTGEKKQATFRLDTGVLRALQEQAEAEGVSQATILEQGVLFHG